jgi:uncharacterized membrane-anchored protein YjiN (DUF445 family)
MADTDWTRIAIEAAGWAASSLAGLLVGVWKGGRRSAQSEHAVEERIAKVENDMKEEVSASEQRIAAKIDEAMQMFGETVGAIREKVNEVERSMIRDFVPNKHFDQMRLESREDIRRINEKLDRLLERR